MEAKRRVLAVASFGGHWTQLLRLRSMLDRFDTTYVSTDKDVRKGFAGNYFRVVDCARDKPWRFVLLGAQCVALLLWKRPHVVLTTGAAPGLAFVILGKILGARTVWIDSIANAEVMSLSGKLAKRWCDLWMTQWEDVAQDTGAKFEGQVL